MSGRLLGIARHDRPKGPMEAIDHAWVTTGEGVHGDFRGSFAATKPTRKRQVTLIEAAAWRAALADVKHSIDWHLSRRNLLLDGLRVPRRRGSRLQIGADLVVEVTGECTPCKRMDALAPGLCAALKPDWRGGFTASVVEDGQIAVGDEVSLLSSGD